MSKYNLGIAKTSILSKLNEQGSIKGFIGLLKESDLLKTELEIFNNLENKHIPNEDLAIKYIDENINLLKEKGYTKETFNAENDKLVPLVEKVSPKSTDKETLYKNIHTLLYESLQGKKSTNVNKLHDSFVHVLEHIKKNDKKAVVEKVELPSIPKEISTDFLIKKSITEFNKKYSTLLTENEMKVFNAIINEDKEAKKATFKTIKEAALVELENTKNEVQSKKKLDVHEQREIDQYTSKINESIRKINLLEFKEESFDKDVISLVDMLGD